MRDHTRKLKARKTVKITLQAHQIAHDMASHYDISITELVSDIICKEGNKKGWAVW